MICPALGAAAYERGHLAEEFFVIRGIKGREMAFWGENICLPLYSCTVQCTPRQLTVAARKRALKSLWFSSRAASSALAPVLL